MVILLTVIHVLVCLFLIMVVLLQSGKAADIAGAFGGMGSQTTFGPRGAATALSKATTVAAGVFMLTSLTLSVVETKRAATRTGGSSVLEKSAAPAAAPAKTPAPQQVPVTLPPISGQAQPGSTPAQPATPAKK